ncbi:transglycosylase SLT domain-containing protein [Streptomyces griseus]|uniref:transglycosylase SLT domain-containing protein n=1 Tax=Streptomyces griseus TaxID=1911 RepID=UPI00055B1D72|nr:transglycosylase SLT domain-containing protein [Streptomyces griseus]
MPKNFLTRVNSPALTLHHKIAFAGVTTLGAAALAFSVVPADARTTTSEVVSSAQVAHSAPKDVKAGVTGQLASETAKIDAIEAQKKAHEKASTAAAAKKAAAQAAAKKKAEAAAKKKAAAQAAAKKKAEAAHKAKAAAGRSAKRAAVKPIAAKSYSNNLDGWIRESLAIMKKHGIPGSYNGIKRNVLRESSGNPNAINNWDINAINGIPSKGLLQVIPPTFAAYHVAGTSWNIYDPVANITAACNYAADKYGSMDNVNSAY